MLIEDKGLILEIKTIHENSLLVKCFSQKHGLISGFYNKKSIFKKSYKSNTNQYNISLGQFINFKYQIKNNMQSGVYRMIEADNNSHMTILLDKVKSVLFESTITLLSKTLKELDPHEELWNYYVNHFIKVINSIEGKSLEDKFILLKEYIMLEIHLLKYSGFGLNLTKCIVTGSTQNLKYLSPKSGNAVSESAGERYKNMLFPLPNFLIQKLEIPQSIMEIRQAFSILDFFLTKYLTQDFSIQREKLKNLAVKFFS